MEEIRQKSQAPQRGSPNVQTVQAQQPIEWDVLVRHSPFLLKHARITATTPEDAKRQFLDRVRQRHEERAGRQRADEPGRLAADRIRLTLADGLKRLHELEFDIRPAADVDAEVKRQKQRVIDVWGEKHEEAVAVA